MKRFFSLIDKYLAIVLINLATILIVLITITVSIQVVYRYVLKAPVGGFGELPMFFLMLAIWISAAVNFGKDRHISIKVTELFIKNKKIYKFNKLIMRVLILIVISIFTILYWDYLKYSILSNEITPGLRLPHWWFVFAIFLSSLFMIFFNIKHCYREFKEMKECFKCQE